MYSSTSFAWASSKKYMERRFLPTTGPQCVCEVEIARRIEHGQRRVLKALSRSPIAIRQILTIGEDLKSGRRSIQEIVTFEEEELTEEKLRKRTDDIVRRIDQLRKHYNNACRLLERLGSIPPKKKAKQAVKKAPKKAAKKKAAKKRAAKGRASVRRASISRNR